MMMDVKNSRELSTPFQEECNTTQFFSGGGRGAILSDLQVVLENDADLIVLIGEEGSGKTMLCRMLKEQWKTKYHKIIFLPQVVESFEDIVRIIAQECNIQYPVEASRADAKQIVLDIIGMCREKGQALLLICDEAEKMYLATFERLRKMIDDANAEGGGLQLLLAGRKSILGHLEQLAVCDFEEISEKRFVLSALNDEDTWNYLNFCIQAHRGTENQEVFTKEAAAKIASMGRGNLRRINVYADESLLSSDADTSFLVLLEHVKDDDLTDEFLPHAPGGGKRRSFLLAGMLGGMLLVALVMFVLGGGDKETKESVVPSISQPGEDIVIIPPMADEETELPEPQKEAVPSADSSKKAEVVTDTKAKEVFAGEQIQQDVAGLSEVEDAQETVQKETVKSLPEETEQSTVVKSPEEVMEELAVDFVETENGIPLLVGKSKILVEKESTMHLIPLQGKILLKEKIAEITRPAQIKVKKVAPLAEISKDPTLARFLIAGVKWLSGGMDDKFSIQLMALKSVQAERNLKQILLQPEYQSVADKLVMLKRPSDPPVVLLFYGVYSSIVEARNARNTMPVFLRKHNPYAISVRGAVEKARIE